jgi:heptosyltransferase III
LKRLIIRPGAIGDFIVSIPAIECLSDACLRAGYLEVWTAARNVPLAARIAQHARSIASTGLDLLELTGPSARLLETLRGFDSIVSWYGANRPEFREAVAGLRLPFQFFAALPPEGRGSHAADFYLAQARGMVKMAPCASDGIPHIACDAIRGGSAVIHPFAGSPKKRWPLERFQELAQRLARRMPFEWCAGPEDELPGARRFEDLYELACWLATARIYIGNDSGPTHLAAAVGTPVVALFGPSDPAVWAPRGAHVTIAAAPALDTITVEQVAGLVQNALENARP